MLSQMTKTKEQAQYMLDKSGEEGFICIDCDCKEAVSHFEKYLDNTYCSSQRGTKEIAPLTDEVERQAL